MTGSWPATPAYPPSYAVAEAVRDITMALAQNDYGVQLCFEHLRHAPVNGETALSAHCNNVMDAYVTQLENANDMRLEFQQARVGLMESVASGFVSIDDANRLVAGFDTSLLNDIAPAAGARSLTIEEPPIAAAPPPPPTRQ